MTDAPAKFYLQWNLINWITVVLMASMAMILIAAVASGIRVYTGQANVDN